MANCCDFYMKIVGETDDVEILVKWLENGNYTDKYHFHNIMGFCVTDEDTNLNQTELNCEGFCKYSVGECMLNGKDSYYQKYIETDAFSMNLIKATRLLHLTVEVIGVESQANFTEHIIVDNGELITNKLKKIFSDEDYNKTTDSDEWYDSYIDKLDSLIEFTI